MKYFLKSYTSTASFFGYFDDLADFGKMSKLCQLTKTLAEETKITSSPETDLQGYKDQCLARRYLVRRIITEAEKLPYWTRQDFLRNLGPENIQLLAEWSKPKEVLILLQMFSQSDLDSESLYNKLAGAMKFFEGKLPEEKLWPLRDLMETVARHLDSSLYKTPPCEPQPSGPA